MARVLVSVRTNGYQMKEGDPLYPLVPCTLKSGQGFANGGQSKSSPFQNCKGNLVTDLRLTFGQFGDELPPLPGNEIKPLSEVELLTLSQIKQF